MRFKFFVFLSRKLTLETNVDHVQAVLVHAMIRTMRYLEQLQRRAQHLNRILDPLQMPQVNAKTI